MSSACDEQPTANPTVYASSPASGRAQIEDCFRPAMTPPYQAILLIAFGGPTSPAEIRPFLARVTRGMPIPPQRLDEVAHHYEAVGGKSPLNEIAARQARALQQRLIEEGIHLPVYLGLRNADPFFVDTLRKMNADGVQRALGLILSSHQTEASWERYQKNIAEARLELGGNAPDIDYCAGWHDHPLFIQTWAESLQASIAQIPLDRRRATPLVFTAHSLPVAMANRSPYVEQLQTTARLVAEKIGHQNWSIAYQSRSGKPTDTWLEPDVNTLIRDLARRNITDMVIAPIGFVCDHVEVLYDLDIEARKTAADAGVTLYRISCPNDHPTFIRMMTEIVLKGWRNPDLF